MPASFAVPMPPTVGRCPFTGSGGPSYAPPAMVFLSQIGSFNGPASRFGRKAFLQRSFWHASWISSALMFRHYSAKMPRLSRSCLGLVCGQMRRTLVVPRLSLGFVLRASPPSNVSRSSRCRPPPLLKFSITNCAACGCRIPVSLTSSAKSPLCQSRVRSRTSVTMCLRFFFLKMMMRSYHWTATCSAPAKTAPGEALSAP